MKKYYLVFLLFLLGCIDAPIPPSHDTTLNLPLASRNVLVKDIIEDTLSPDSLSLFREGYEIDTIYISDVLKLDSLVEDTVLTLKDIPINKVYRDTVFFILGRLLPWLASHHGEIVDSIPDTSFSLFDTLTFIEDFQTVLVDSGELRIIIFNKLPIEIDSLRLTIIAIDTLEINFPYIPPNQSRERTCDLASHNLSNSCSLIVDGWTRKKYSVPIDTLDNITIDVKLTLDRLRSMIGKFPACTTDISLPFAISPHRINRAVVDSGIFNLSIQNPVRSEFDWLITSDECSFLPFSCQILEGSTDTFLLIQSDTIKPLDPDSIKFNTILSTNGGTVVDTIDQSDTFFIELKISNFALSKFDGFIDTVITSDIPEVGQFIDYAGLDLSGIVFDSVWLYFDIQNEVDASPNVDLVMTGIKGINSRTLYISEQLNHGVNYREICGDTITNFVNFFPDSINVTGQVSLTGPIKVESSDRVYGEIGLMAPIDFHLNDTLLIEPDTFILFEVPEEVTQVTILETKLLTYIQNSTPLNGDISIFLTPDSANLGPPLFVIDFKKGISDTLTDISVEELLKHTELWAKLKVRFFPAHIRIFTRDRLIVKALLRVKTKVGD